MGTGAGAVRMSRLRWTVPPAALAAFTANTARNRQPQQQDQKVLSTSAAHYDPNSGLRTPKDVPASSQEPGEGSIWSKIVQKLDGVKHTVGSREWVDIGGNFTNYIPDWARLLPATAQKLQRELSLAPGSLADDIWKEARDPDINPEILRDASVRVSGDLCDEELEFRRKRRQHAAKALALYLDIPEKDIHPDDVPVIAMCGSGGGLRALVAGAGSCQAVQEAGLWDCVTYTAGVSGSCWLQTLYHSSITGQNFNKLVDHLKNRLGVHIAFPHTALNLLTTAPTNKYLLTGLVEKLKGDPGADFGLVDIYGLLLGARLMVPRGELGVSDQDLKLSNQRANLLNGAHPLPIYAAVRHEIPVPDEQDNERAKEHTTPEKLIQESRDEAWFQWFEFTPYEFFCEELNAGIPTWALGRHFDGGVNQQLPQGEYPIPELRLPGLMGVWGSAFCATLSHYYKEVRPLVTGLTGFGAVDSLIQGKNKDLIRVHPIDPAAIPNYVMGMKNQLPPSCPQSIFRSRHLRLMDAGMSNNLPIYPLIRPGRDVDIIVAFDASADIKRENWLSVVDGYARQRGIKGWPVGAGWPKESENLEDTKKALREPQNISNEKANQKISRAQSNADHLHDTLKATESNQTSKSADSDLTYCNTWVGTMEERISEEEPPPSKRLFHPHSDDSESDFHLMRPDAGIAVVYFPFIPNSSAPDLPPNSPPTRPRPAIDSLQDLRKNDSETPTRHPSSIDPENDDFLSTWNFIYTPEQIDSVVSLAKANFAQGKDQVRRVVRAVYERKKSDRLQREMKALEKKVKNEEEEHRKRMEEFGLL